MGFLCPKPKPEDPVETSTITKKVVVVGPSNVGKTTIINQLLTGKVSAKHDPSTKSGVYTKIFDVHIGKSQRKLVLNIWDTPGGDEYGNMKDLDYTGADVAVMVYSIDKASTFDDMDNVKATADSHCNPIYVLVGNKVDLDK